VEGRSGVPPRGCHDGGVAPKAAAPRAARPSMRRGRAPRRRPRRLRRRVLAEGPRESQNRGRAVVEDHAEGRQVEVAQGRTHSVFVLVWGNGRSTRKKSEHRKKRVKEAVPHLKQRCKGAVVLICHRGSELGPEKSKQRKRRKEREVGPEPSQCAPPCARTLLKCPQRHLRCERERPCNVPEKQQAEKHEAHLFARTRHLVLFHRDFHSLYFCEAPCGTCNEA
jgi:hypothetical protein